MFLFQSLLTREVGGYRKTVSCSSRAWQGFVLRDKTFRRGSHFGFWILDLGFGKGTVSTGVAPLDCGLRIPDCGMKGRERQLRVTSYELRVEKGGGADEFPLP